MVKLRVLFAKNVIQEKAFLASIILNFAWFCNKNLHVVMESFFFVAGKKQNGTTPRSGSLSAASGIGAGVALTVGNERKGKLAVLGRLLKPWKWRRRAKSEKLEATSRCK